MSNDDLVSQLWCRSSITRKRQRTILCDNSIYMNNHADALEAMNALLATMAPTSPHVLEAECGHRSVVHLGNSAVITRIDIAPTELRHNDLRHEARVGDIQDCELERSSYDVAVCWQVLEHLERPEAALANLSSALKPGGLLVLGVPNRRSLKARLVRLSPRRLHSFVWHRLYPSAPADRGPFPVVHHPGMAQEGLRRFARERDMAIVHEALYESELQQRLRSRLHIGNRAWERLSLLLRGTPVDVLDSDVILVLRKSSYEH